MSDTWTFPFDAEFGRTRTMYRCPLLGCGWEHESRPVPARRGATSLDGLVRDLVAAQDAADDAACRAHLDGHTVEEFLTTIRQLEIELAEAKK